MDAAYSVVLVGANRLALDQLRQITGRDRVVSIVTRFDELTVPSSLPPGPVAIVVDLGSVMYVFAAWLRAVASAYPSATIVAIGPAFDTAVLCRIFMLGVHGFLTYDEAHTELDRAVARLRAGELVFPRAAIDRLARQTRGSRGGGTECPRVTEREAEILDLLHLRLSNKEIGSALCISERTVRFHLANVFRKFGVDNRYAAAEVVGAGSAPGEQSRSGIGLFCEPVVNDRGPCRSRHRLPTSEDDLRCSTERRRRIQ